MSEFPHLSAQAINDLDEIWEYVAERNVEAADELVADIIEKVRFLANFPKTGRQRDEINPGLRSAAIRSYIIFFRATDDAIKVARIFHGARDLDSIKIEAE